MVEGVEVHFDEGEGHLRLDCGEAEFCQIGHRILTEAAGDGRFDPYLDGLRSILVRRAAAIDGGTVKRMRRGLGIVLIAAVLALALAIQVVGLVAVARWLLGAAS